jgi:DeoR/GlpR family transcriptional regulator of sugar metabolism
MLAEERHSRIVSILKARGFATVEELAQTFSVSDMTIRRDLEKCQTRGMLQRCHGGAVLIGRNQQEISFDEKSSEHREIKKNIARAAAKFVEEGTAVFVDAGTTGFEIAQCICNIRNITIISNDVHTIFSLLNSNAQLICIGGAIQKKTGSAFDYFSQQTLDQIHFDIAFLGAHSIDTNFFVMTPTSQKMSFKRKILEHSSLNYLAADHSKFNKKALYSINNLNAYSGIITDYAFSEDELKIIKEKEITIISILGGIDGRMCSNS